MAKKTKKRKRKKAKRRTVRRRRKRPTSTVSKMLDFTLDTSKVVVATGAGLALTGSVVKAVKSVSGK